jgi:hypothetical protein
MARQWSESWSHYGDPESEIFAQANPKYSTSPSPKQGNCRSQHYTEKPNLQRFRY